MPPKASPTPRATFADMTKQNELKDVNVPGARPKFNLFTSTTQGNNEANKTVRLALVDLVAWPRTSHVAAAASNLKIFELLCNIITNLASDDEGRAYESTTTKMASCAATMRFRSVL